MISAWEIVDDIEQECLTGDDPECILNRIWKKLAEYRHVELDEKTLRPKAPYSGPYN